MKSKGWLVLWSLLLLLILLSGFPSAAQGAGPFLAFLNSSGQLIVSSGDGSYRWIVTNPSEIVNRQIGFSWSPQGRQIFFTIGNMNDLSLRVADIVAQSAGEIGHVGGQVSGGSWTPDGTAIIVGVDNQVMMFPVNGGQPSELASASGNVILRSPFDNPNRFNQQQPSSLSPDGRYLFYGVNGQVAVQPVGGQATELSGDVTAPASGLWAAGAPLVAYATTSNGNSALAVTNADSGETLVLDSGRTAPISAVAWRPGTLQLVYRDATNYVRLVDLTCLASDCEDNPLQNGMELLPGSANDLQVDSNFAYYIDANAVMLVDLACVSGGYCINSAVPLGSDTASQTTIDAVGNTLVYTAGSGANREVRWVDVGCMGGCEPVTALPGAVAGLASPNGDYVVVEMVNGGLNVLRLSDGQITYLSDPSGQSLLPFARWSAG